MTNDPECIHCGSQNSDKMHTMEDDTMVCDECIHTKVCDEWTDEKQLLKQRQFLWSIQDRIELNSEEQALVDGLVNWTDNRADNVNLHDAASQLLEALELAANFIENEETGGVTFFQAREAWRNAIAKAKS